MDGLNDSQQSQHTAKSHLTDSMTQTKSSESAGYYCQGSKNCVKDLMMESQKSSLQPPRLEELNIDTGHDIIRLEGFFNITLDGEYLLVSKVNEQGEVFASLGYLNPLSFSIGFVDKN